MARLQVVVLSQWMGRCRANDQRIIAPRHDIELWMMHRTLDASDVDTVFEKGSGDAVCIFDAYLQRYLRMLRDERTQHPQVALQVSATCGCCAMNGPSKAPTR